MAVGTVKRHLNNIFGKLHVQSRLHAVAHARDLGLLSGGAARWRWHGELRKPERPPATHRALAYINHALHPSLHARAAVERVPWMARPVVDPVVATAMTTNR